MKRYHDYLNEVKSLVNAGHNRSDVLKVLKIQYLLNDGDVKPDDELGQLINDIEDLQHEALFK